MRTGSFLIPLGQFNQNKQSSIETSMVPNEHGLIAKAKRLDYPTPFFYTSKDILAHNYQIFTDLFDDAEIYYALKANSDPRILVRLDQLGCGFEAASAFEIDMLIKVGVYPHKIIYGTSLKPLDHIRRAARLGIDRFAADSKEEIEKIAAIAPGARVFIRAIVDDKGSVFTMSERFGSPVSEVKELILLARKLGLKAYGVSFYVGSQATMGERWAKGIATVRPVFEELKQEGVKLEVINIGGGFPVIYKNHSEAPHLREIVVNIHNELHKLPYIPKILMEPGRGIVASSTVTVATVIAKTTRQGQTWLCLDGGVYNCFYEAMIHQGATQYKVHPATVPETEADQMSCVLTGPTGDSLDIITRDARLPASVTIGDRLIFENTGAYTVTMASPFNGFPQPKLYFD